MKKSGMMRFLSGLTVVSAILCIAVSMAISPKEPYPLTVFQLQAENPPSKDINMKGNVINFQQGKWDINQATAEQLMQVEGIGEKRAQQILQYLYRKGGIAQMEQLLEIDGIGEELLQRLKEQFTAG